MTRRISVLLLALIVPACLNDASDDEDAPGPTPGSVLASGVIGDGGGTVEVTDPTSPYFGAKIEVPPDALAAPVTISIRPTPGEFAPDVHTLEFGPAELAFAVPARVTVAVSLSYVQDFRLALLTGMRVVSHTSAGSDILNGTQVDTGRGTVTAETSRSGRFAALLFPSSGGLAAAHYRLIGQARMLTTEAFVRTIEGEDYVVSPLSPDARPVIVGKGSLAAFGTSARNLVLVHSTGDDAMQFVGDEDLVTGLSAEYDTIVTYQFPSGRPIAENANWLYNELRRLAGPGFAVDLLGYSMGGVVVRYAVERSKDDPAAAVAPQLRPRERGRLERHGGARHHPRGAARGDRRRGRRGAHRA